ncbi:unnamed protein product [Vitrella brassicaformis CCMP3155]|uniref:Voltage-gated hydrogen channel 1 n=1 Tax=Vitrella brassicaformis (strain CCMP3155) TaxID=1169540 RepID=A0A0G4F510_VITBC|nr:unnamed protein product [Vitrella brassicaformis CCMP3155]|eukprot:CEM07561.1 unnamed protein product [Vitrella brassicaformis CCMP3155]
MPSGDLQKPLLDRPTRKMSAQSPTYSTDRDAADATQRADSARSELQIRVDSAISQISLRIAALDALQTGTVPAPSPSQALAEEVTEPPPPPFQIKRRFTHDLIGTYGVKNNWRGRLALILDSRVYIFFMLAVLGIDVIVVLLELLALEGVFGGEGACAFKKEGLAHGGEKGHGEGHSTYETIEHTLHIIGLTILCIFNLDVLLHLVAFGWRFFYHLGYVTDLLVAPTSLALELYFPSAGSLIAVVRMWRIVRIVHGIAIMQDEFGKEKLHALKEVLEELRVENNKLEVENEHLRKRISAPLLDTIHETSNGNSQPQIGQQGANQC